MSQVQSPMEVTFLMVLFLLFPTHAFIVNIFRIILEKTQISDSFLSLNPMNQQKSFRENSMMSQKTRFFSRLGDNWIEATSLNLLVNFILCFI